MSLFSDTQVQNYLFNVHTYLEQFFIKYHRLLLLSVVFLFITKTYLDHKQDILEQKQFLMHPIKSDVYILDIGHFQTNRKYQEQYRVAQIIEVNEDHIILQQSAYTYRKKKGIKSAISLDRLMSYKFFLTEPITFKRAELTRLFNRDAIDDVYRPVDIYVMGGIVKKRPKPIAQKDNLSQNQIISKENEQGIRYYQLQEFTLAQEAFLEAAKQGNAWAQYNLAEMLEKGEGSKVNLQQAQHWYAKASVQQHSLATQALEKLCDRSPEVCVK